MKKVLVLSLFFLAFCFVILAELVPSEETEGVVKKDAGLVLAEEKKIELVDIFKDTEIVDAGEVTFSAKGILVMDAETGKIIFSKNPKEILSIASITKLMSLVVFVETKTDLEKIVTVEESDYNNLQNYVNAGDVISQIPLLAGDQIKVKDAVYSAIVHSANNAVKIFARATEMDEDEFIRKMNKKAGDLNLQNTYFTEPTGLDTANVSTAYDIALLADYAFKNPFIRGVTMTRKYDFRVLNTNKYKQALSTNWLLDMFNPDYYQIVGGKTGFLGEVGFNVVVKARNWNEKEIIVVVLGAATNEQRFSEAKSLIIEGFKKIE